MTLQPNIKTAIKELGATNPTAKVLFEYLSSRKRVRDCGQPGRYKLLLRRLGYAVNDKEFNQVWETLDRLGIGSLDREPGKPEVFRWTFDMKTVAKLAEIHPPILRTAPTKVEVERRRHERRSGAKAVLYGRVELSDGRVHTAFIPYLIAEDMGKVCDTIRDLATNERGQWGAVKPRFIVFSIKLPGGGDFKGRIETDLKSEDVERICELYGTAINTRKLDRRAANLEAR